VVGLITSLPLDGGMNPMAMMGGGRPPPPQVVMEQIRDFFEIKSVAQDVKEIPADVDVLMVAQPDRLTPEAAMPSISMCWAAARCWRSSILSWRPMPGRGR
jgi:ABC-type uncharacterized transport system involved in gliding motility auxiliary subunit